MARNGFQNSAYQAYLAQVAGQFQQVVASINSVDATMTRVTASLTRLMASETTPDASFGTADAADVAQLSAWLSQWTTVQPAALSFQQAVAAFLASPPQV